MIYTARRFDAGSDLIDFGVPTYLASASSLALALRINIGAGSLAFVAPVQSHPLLKTDGWQLRHDSAALQGWVSDSLIWTANDGVSQSHLWVSNTGADPLAGLAAGWHSIVVVWTGGGLGTLALYVDGAAVAMRQTAFGTFSALPASPGHLVAGFNGADSRFAAPVHLAIADVGIWTGLTGPDAATLAAGPTSQPSALVSPSTWLDSVEFTGTPPEVGTATSGGPPILTTASGSIAGTTPVAGPALWPPLLEVVALTPAHVHQGATIAIHGTWLRATPAAATITFTPTCPDLAFSPATVTLTASGSSSFDTVATISPTATPGARTITWNNDGGLAPLATATAVDAITALVATVEIDPGGNLAVARCTDTDGTPTRIVSHAGGATISVDGGPAVGLANHLIDPKGFFLAFPLATLHYDLVDDADAGFSIPTGTWTTVPRVGPPWGFAWANDACQTSPDGGATAVWTFADVPPGLYSVMVPIDHDLGTVTARYVIKDGGSTVATHDFDQSVKGPFDGIPFNQMHWSRVGNATITTGTTVTVTLSNPSGTGTLFADSVLLERLVSRADGTAVVPLGATVAVTFPDACVTTAAGTTGPQTVAATLETDADWFPFDPADVHMKLGKNLKAPSYNLPNMVYADRGRAAAGPWSGGTVDARTGVLLSLAAGQHASTVFLRDDGAGSGIDHYGTLCAQPTGDWHVLYDAVGTPTLAVDTLGAFPAPVATPPSYTTPIAGPGQVYAFAVAVLQNAEYTQGLGLVVSSGSSSVDYATNVRIYDPQTPIDWTRMVHPVTYARLAGRGYTCIRWMEAQQTNYSNNATWAHITRGDVQTLNGIPTYGSTATVSSVDPVAGSDLQYFGFDSGRAYFQVTTMGPHGFFSGQRVTWSGADFNVYGAGPLWPDTDGGDGITTGIELATGLDAGCVLVTGPDTFLVVGYRTSPRAGDQFRTAATTLTSSQTVDGTATVAWTGGIPPEHIWQISNELGIAPWVCAPNAAIAPDPATGAATPTDYTVELVKSAAANLDPSLDFYFEYNNESWGGTIHSLLYTVYCGNKLLDTGVLAGVQPGYGFQGYASGLLGKLARDTWTNANGLNPSHPRDPAKFHAMYVGQLGNSGVTTQGLSAAAQHGYDFEGISPGAPYLNSNNTALGAPLSDDLAGAWGRLDVDSLVSLWPMLSQEGIADAFGQNVSAVANVDVAYGRTGAAAYSSKPLLTYEGGLADTSPFGGVAGADQYYQNYRGFAAMFHPRMYRAILSTNQFLQDTCGLGNGTFVRFTHDGTSPLFQPGPNTKNLYWFDDVCVMDTDGTGDPAENPVPAKLDAPLASEMGGAMNHWVALRTDSPTPTPTPTPTPIPTPTPTPTPDRRRDRIHPSRRLRDFPAPPARPASPVALTTTPTPRGGAGRL